MALLSKPWLFAGLVGLLASGLVTALYFPLFELGWMANPAFDFVDLVIRFSPGQIATWSIETFGQAGKVMVEAGGLAGWILIGAAIAALSYRFSPRPESVQQRILITAGAHVTFAFAVELVAGLSFYGTGGVLWLIITSSFFGAVAQLFAIAPAPAPPPPVEEATWPPPPPPSWLAVRSRRELLAFSAAVAVTGSIGALAGQQGLLAASRTPAADAIGAIGQSGSPLAPSAIDALDGFDTTFAPAANTRPIITSNDDFYLIDIYTRRPTFARANWSMQVGGLVERELNLSIDDIEAMPMREQYGTLQCISNEVGGELISTALWTGVELGTVLDMAGVLPGAQDVVLYAPGGYDDSITIAKALEPSTLLTYGMNGVPLPTAHGFPLRAYVPNIYGMKNVKWITRIEVTDNDHEGYWQRRGWSDIAIVKTTSAWDLPGRKRTGRVAAGEDIIGGIAFAGNRGISAVEWRLADDEIWKPAEMEDQVNVTTWRRWKANLGLSPGTHQMEVRAFDGNGDEQPSKRTATHPDGAGGYHLIQLAVEP